MDNFGTVCMRYNINPEEFSEMNLGEVLLESHRNYTTPIMAIMNSNIIIKGLSHITGGGFIENIPRIMPKGLGVKIKKSSYSVPPIFQLISKVANIEENEIYRTLNMGIGMVMIIDSNDKDKIFELIKDIEDQEVVELGSVNSKEGLALI